MRLERKGTPTLIAEALREDIQVGRLAAGLALNQNELAERFGVSRIPVREALRQLEADGTIRYVPSRGAVVAVYTPEELRERFEIRCELEPLALRLALPHLTEPVLRAVARELTAMRDENDIPRWGKHHAAFHRLLYAPAERPRLCAIIASLYLNVSSTLAPDAMRRHMRILDDEHDHILAACRNGELQRAVELLRAHVEGTRDRMLSG
jgi:DNA-binding GntR family transcriptional regulator